MTRRDVLLGLVAAGEAVDPIRIMKGVFLFSQDPRVPDKLKYGFVPYSYGPCSFDVYGDLNHLVASGLIRRISGDSRWPTYAVTAKGRQSALEALTQEQHLAPKILRARKYVDARSFSTLLRDIYAKFPEYATKSVFKS